MQSTKKTNNSKNQKMLSTAKGQLPKTVATSTKERRIEKNPEVKAKTTVKKLTRSQKTKTNNNDCKTSNEKKEISKAKPALKYKNTDRKREEWVSKDTLKQEMKAEYKRGFWTGCVLVAFGVMVAMIVFLLAIAHTIGFF